MKSNCKFLYALAAFITVKLFFLSILFSADSDIFGYQFPLAAHPMEYLFRLLFILFIISPPLVVLFLYLIWKELKNRNKLK